MRAEIDVSSPSSGAALHARAKPAVRLIRPRLRLDWFELLLLIAFAAVSMWVVALDVYRAHVHGLVWTGTDGFYVVDQLQYLAWIQEAAKHVLVSDLFVLRPTAADYFQPAIVISGGLKALGVPPWLSLLLWKPVAVIAVVYGMRAYAAHTLGGLWPRRIALTLGLFFGSITLIYGSPGVLGDLFPAFLSWGYTFGLLAIALMLFSLVAYERARSRFGGESRWVLWTPGLLGAVAGLLHPWQGELLILIVLGAEAMLWALERRRPRLELPVLTVVLTAMPLLYYEILGRVDLTWKLARVASKHAFSLATIMLAIVPLLLPALLVYRDRPRTFLAAVNRVWLLAALVIYILSASALSATPLHAFEGITLPLSILAIEGIRRAGLERLPASRWIVAALVLAATVPATVVALQTARTDIIPRVGNANFIRPEEQRALHFLARDRRPGAVLTSLYLGEVVPGETGRKTYLGDCLWAQPNCIARAKLVQLLFHGPMRAETTRRYVQRLGARFVLASCTTRPEMTAVLAPLTESEERFGCAAVYVMRSWRR
jgi:hypothetical protein